MTEYERDWMTEYDLETGLHNWLGTQKLTDVEADLDDFMSNVIDAGDDGSMSDEEWEWIESFAREWIEERIEEQAA